MKRLSSFLLIISGVWLALKLPYCEYGFLTFFAGHLMLARLLIHQKEYSLAVPQFVFLLIDMVGIYRWIFTN